VPDSVYFQVDSRQGPWSVATAGNSTFTGTVPPLPPGYHTLYAFAGDGQEATSAQSGSPLTGVIQSYGFVVQLPTTVQATVGTNIPGVAFTVDGVSYTSTQTFNWANSSAHTVGVPSFLQVGTAGTQYLFSAWNDGGAISHTVIVETYPTTYTANLTTQYLLTTAATPGGTVSAGGFFNANATVTVRATPAAGYGFAQTFTAEYSDPNGVADLSKVALLFNSAISSAMACSVSYSPSLNLLYLVNDVGSGLQGSVTPGSSATVSNSQCKLSGTGSSYSTSGNTATLNVSLTFNVAFLAATEHIYLYAAEANGTSVGWSKEGTWGGAPTFASLTPNSGSATAQTFAAVVSDPNGIADLTGVYLLFNTSITAGKACYVLYYPSSNLLYLKNDAGTAVSAGIAPGSSATASNSQCTLAGTGSSDVTSGDMATLNVALTFTNAFLAPPKAIYTYALEKDGITSGWVREGTWGVSAGLPSILPESADQPPNSYTAKYTDPNGVADLTTLGFLISSSSTQLYNACYVSYFPALNELRLENDNGTGWVSGTLTPGSSGTLSNSQCTLSGTGTSYTTSVHTGTLTLAVAYYYSGYEGFVYLLATELNFTSTG